MRVLVTGAAGFVGPHVVRALRTRCGPDITVIPTSRDQCDHPSFGRVQALDVTDRAAVVSAVAQHRPTHIIHLAGIAAPAAAADSPEWAWRVHVQGTLNVAHALIETSPACWLINAGSGLVYGDSAGKGEPLDESTLLSPVDEYGATKAAGDLALGALTRRGLMCVRTRPFNHTGPGQTEAFVVTAFAMQIARIEAGLDEPVIRVGNLNAKRDFLDVRDVVDAYARIVQNSKVVATGTILNIASGEARSVGSILEGLLSLSPARISVEHDPARMRPSDPLVIVGNAEKARKLLAWSPGCPLEATLADVLADCRDRIAMQGATALHNHTE